MQSKFKFPEDNKEEIKKKTISSLLVCWRGFIIAWNKNAIRTTWHRHK